MGRVKFFSIFSKQGLKSAKLINRVGHFEEIFWKTEFINKFLSSIPGPGYEYPIFWLIGKRKKVVSKEELIKNNERIRKTVENGQWN